IAVPRRNHHGFHSLVRIGSRASDGQPSLLTDSVTRDSTAARESSRAMGADVRSRGQNITLALCANLTKPCIVRGKAKPSILPRSHAVAVALLAGGCAGTIRASAHVPNPISVAAASASDDVSYDIGIFSEAIKRPLGC